MYTNTGHPYDHAEYRYRDRRLSVQPFTTDSHFHNAFGPTGGETSSQGTAWVNRGTLPPTSHRSPSHTVSPQPSPTPHHTGSHRSSTVPAEAACFPCHLGVSRHPLGVVENRYFDACEWRYQRFSGPVFISLTVLLGFMNVVNSYPWLSQTLFGIPTELRLRVLPWYILPVHFIICIQRRAIPGLRVVHELLRDVGDQRSNIPREPTLYKLA